MDMLLGIVAGVFIGIVIGHWQAWPYIKKLQRHRHELRVALRSVSSGLARHVVDDGELRGVELLLQETCPLCDDTDKCQCCPPEAL